MRTAILLAAVFFSGCLGSIHTSSAAKMHPELFPKLKTEYDEITGLTRTVSYIQLAPTMALRLSAVGDANKPPRLIDLSIHTSARHWEHLDSPLLVLLVDGERMWFRNAKHSGLVSSRGVIEDVTADLTPGVLEKLSNADSIKGRLDAVTFEVPTSDLQTIRRFAARIESGAPVAEERSDSENPAK